VTGQGTITLADAKQIVSLINDDISQLLDPIVPVQLPLVVEALAPLVIVPQDSGSDVVVEDTLANDSDPTSAASVTADSFVSSPEQVAALDAVVAQGAPPPLSQDEMNLEISGAATTNALASAVDPDGLDALFVRDAAWLISPIPLPTLPVTFAGNSAAVDASTLDHLVIIRQVPTPASHAANRPNASGESLDASFQDDAWLEFHQFRWRSMSRLI
jgi:hypothetical protein